MAEAIFKQYQDKNYQPFWLIIKSYENDFCLADLVTMKELLGKEEWWPAYHRKQIDKYNKIKRYCRNNKPSYETVEKFLVVDKIPKVLATGLVLSYC